MTRKFFILFVLFFALWNVPEPHSSVDYHFWYYVQCNYLGHTREACDSAWGDPEVQEDSKTITDFCLIETLSFQVQISSYFSCLDYLALDNG